MPIKKNNQAIGIRKNGSTKVPSGATSEPITLNAAMQPNDKIKGIRVLYSYPMNKVLCNWNILNLLSF